MSKHVKIRQLIEDGRMKVGDRIGYHPCHSSFKPSFKATGVIYEKSLRTQDLYDWRINGIDYESGKIHIIPLNCLNQRQVRLKGITGFLNCDTILDTICRKLYSNESIKAIARSVNVYDISRDYISPLDFGKKYAYTTNPDAGLRKMFTTRNGELYQVKLCDRDQKFYSCEGGILKKDDNGIPYMVPDDDNFVFHKETPLYIKSKVICTDKFIIPASYTSSMAFGEMAYCIRVVCTDGSVVSVPMAYTTGECGEQAYGIMPLVSLDFDTNIDFENSRLDPNKTIWKLELS